MTPHVTLQSPWPEILPANAPAPARRVRWATWLRLARAAGQGNQARWWADAREMCGDCKHRRGGWCVPQALPCNVNPILTLQGGEPGMACMGMGKETRTEEERMNAPTETIALGGQVIQADVGMCHPSPTNPRKEFAEAALKELADSIKLHGLAQPIVVREMPQAMRAALGTEAALEIVCGERRWRAHQLAGLPTIECLLRDLTDDQVIRLQILENLQREGLSPIEEAEGFDTLRTQGLSVDEIAGQLGKSRGYVYGKLKLLALAPEPRQALRSGAISEAVALLVARIHGADLQGVALRRVQAPDLDGAPISYRAAQRILREHFMVRLDPRTLHFDPTAEGVAGKGPCTHCPNRMGTDPDCDPENADVCTDTACYADKTAAGVRARRAEQDAQAATEPPTAPDTHAPDAPPPAAPKAPAARPHDGTRLVPEPQRTPRDERDAPLHALKLSYIGYRQALADAIVSHPPLMIVGPLLHIVARAVTRSQYGEYEDDGQAMAMLLNSIASDLAQHPNLGHEDSIESLATAVGIDPAELLALHVPVPAGCARPDEHGVYPVQECIPRMIGKHSAEINLARTAEGWRGAIEIHGPMGGESAGIRIHDTPFPTLDLAIAHHAERLREKLSKRAGTPKKLLDWAAELVTRAGGPSEIAEDLLG